MEYLFLPAARGDAEAVFSLIWERIRWMDRVGIEQWNRDDYWYAFPEAYYEKAIAEKQLFVLKEPDSGRIAGAGVLTFTDSGWTDDGHRSVFLHNFVAALDGTHAGDTFLEKCEAYGRNNGAEFLRLDCKSSNLRLNRYYEQHGYRTAGQISDGPYHGTKREKRLH